MKMNRRELGRALAGGALISSFTKPDVASAQEKQIGYAIIGLGRISMQHFMPAIKNSSKCRVTGLVSGHPDKAAKMAAEYGVPKTAIYDYKNMDAMIDNKDIDAVYVALPNSMHAEYTIRSAKAGKHVLCEKPMATTVSEGQQMIDACSKAGKKLMIAYRCQLEPTHLEAIKMLREGRLGKIESISGAYGFNIGQNEWRSDKALAGGGPLMDVGIYCLNACRYLTGEEPKIIQASSSVIDQDGRFKGVEENLSWVMQFPSGAIASCATTYGAAMPGTVTVYASKGVLRIEPAFNYQGIKMTTRIAGERQPIEMQLDEKDPIHFQREAEHFADCINQNRKPVADGAEGLQDMKIMMDIYSACQRRA